MLGIPSCSLDNRTDDRFRITLGGGGGLNFAGGANGRQLFGVDREYVEDKLSLEHYASAAEGVNLKRGSMRINPRDSLSLSLCRSRLTRSLRLLWAAPFSHSIREILF